MNLKNMKRSRSENGVYTLTLADDEGAEDYELTISGSHALVEKVFEKSDFEITIGPKTNGKEAERRAQGLWTKYSSTKTPAAAPAEDLGGLAKFIRKDPTTKNAIVVSLRRTRGEGTFFALWFPLLFIPRGVSLFFPTPHASIFCQGAVTPTFGDADLFLTLNGFSPPVVASGTRAGQATDSVSHVVPIAFVVPGPAPIIIRSPPVMPFYRVLGFTTCQTNFFCWSI